jgi:hypothetical protein
MASSRRDEERLLSADERDLVAKTRRPALEALGSEELSQVIGRLRERRDRAKGLAGRQRREMRGKAAPAGAQPASDDTGTRAKSAVLGEALKRANTESSRRRRKSARADLVDNQRRALSMKQDADAEAPKRPKSRTANKGMRSVPNETMAPSGALNEEGHRPVLERSRKVR